LVLINNLGAFIWYYLLYSLILSGLLIGLRLVNYYNSFGGVNWSESGGLIFWIFSGSYFLSLAGMPPFSGFFLKLVGVVVVVSSSPFFIGVLIFSAIVRLYFYLSIFLRSVFCVSSVDYMVLSSHLRKRRIPLIIFILGLLNWLGGIPLLLFFCFFIFSNISLI
jgi:NADH:ubiquinone oxidoreductase subunit 2 (subunit N)